jgi:peptidoglycan L-alanyl-D-glutamate endopeptidase CwlK
MNKWIVIIALIIVVLVFINRKRVKETVVNGINFLMSAEQEAYIKNLHPDVKNTFRQFISDIQKETGYTVVITSGYRSFANQASLYAQNNSNAKPGYSFHNYGLALDINAVKNGSWLRKSSPVQQWKNSGIIDIADRMGLRWGGRFNGYTDNVHFDLGKNYNTTALYNQAQIQFGTDPKFINGNQVMLV